MIKVQKLTGETVFTGLLSESKSIEDAISKLESATKEQVSTAHSEAPAASKPNTPTTTSKGLDIDDFMKEFSGEELYHINIFIYNSFS